MPLVTPPPFALNAQYRPNIFVVSMTSANPLILSQATIVVNMSSITTIQKTAAYNIGTTYYFIFDVSKVLQTVSAPKGTGVTSVFTNTINASYEIASTDIHTRVGLIIQYFYNDPTTGLLTLFGSSDTIATDYPAISATRQTRDNNSMGMVDYIIDYPLVGGVYDRYFLTKLPFVYPTATSKTSDPILICNGENLTMSYVPSSSTNALRVVLYDADQNTVGVAGFIQIVPGSTLTPRTIGAGIQQLLATTMTPANSLIGIQTGYHYSIQAGNLVLPATFTLQGVKYMFKVVECCGEKSIRLHWLNRLGGSDAYTFISKKVITQKTKSEKAQTPLAWNIAAPHTKIGNRGSFKIQQETVKEYEISSSFYTEQQGEWIAELLSSPEVYMETSLGLIAVVITDSSIKITEDEELINVTINFIESNEISVQSN
jgi:hypothetical protein